MLGDLFEAPSDPFREAGFDEVGLGIFPEAFLIKGIFEVLEGESEVEDGHIRAYVQKKSQPPADNERGGGNYELMVESPSRLVGIAVT